MKINRRHALLIAAFVITILLFSWLYNWKLTRKKPHLNVLDTNVATIAAIADEIIPKTDSPSASDACVGQAIVLMVKDCLDVKEQHIFTSGLRDVLNMSVDRFGKPFVECTGHERLEILNELEANYYLLPSILRKVRRKVFGRPFIRLFKELTVIGYCTSRMGATEGLAYDYVPMQYQSCILCTPNQKVWAIQ